MALNFPVAPGDKLLITKPGPDRPEHELIVFATSANSGRLGDSAMLEVTGGSLQRWAGIQEMTINTNYWDVEYVGPKPKENQT